MCYVINQDGTKMLVAVKTCKSHDDLARTDQLLKEAGQYYFLTDVSVILLMCQCYFLMPIKVNLFLLFLIIVFVVSSLIRACKSSRFNPNSSRLY